MESILSIDVEDWFHISDLDSAPSIEEWSSAKTLIEDNFLTLLKIFDRHDIKTTCFFLGWIAQRFPHLVKEAHKRGHEIASHGYSHELIYNMSKKEFYQDIVKSKEILEDITGEQIFGYRAPSFSITEDTQWAFDELIRAGYRYDSSVFPLSRQQGGFKTDKFSPHKIERKKGTIIEFPLTVKETFGFRWSYFGGAYLRLSPYFLTRYMAKKVLGQGRPVIFYVHPREINPDHPKLAMGFTRHTRTYFGVRTLKKKLYKIINDFKITTYKKYIKKYSIAEGIP